MAKNTKPKNSTKTKVNITKVKAKQTPADTQPKQPTTKKSTPETKTEVKTKKLSPIKRLLNYIRDSWNELKLVRWTTRRQTWRMVFAVIVYSLFFFVLVVSLDYVFNQLFKLMLG